jgi:hypothetical protein
MVRMKEVPMITSVECTKSFPAWHTDYLAMLPAIRNRACFAFRELDPDARDEAVQQILVSTFIAFRRLVKQERTHLASPSALARFAIAQVRVGRCIGVRLNSQDVLSPYAQRRRGFRVERLHQAASNRAWREVVVEDRRTAPAEVALTRVDFEDWLGTLSPRQQTLVNSLAKGHTATEIASQLRLSIGRVSQIRRKLAESWDEFHGETNQGGPAAVLS